MLSSLLAQVETGRGAGFGFGEFLLLVHILGVAVWVGGQVVMSSVMMALRSSEKADNDVRPAAAQGFAKVAWPALAVAIFTGIWMMIRALGEDPSPESSWSMVLGIKMMFVALSGAAAWAHQKSKMSAVKAVTAAVALLTALAAVVMAVTLG